MAEKKVSLPQKPLKARKRAKKKKPDFVRPESWRYIKLKESWRRPRGLDHKVRRKIKGWPPGVSVGYKGPKVARGLHPSGYREVLVHNAKEVSVIDPKTEAARIAHTVGKRKRVQIITEAKKREVFILNFKPVKETAEEEKEEEEAEETEAAEEKSEKKPAAEKKKAVKKEAAKPKRASPARQKSSPKEQKPQKKEQKAPAKGSAKKAEKPKKQPKKPRRKAKAEGGAEK